ncbi:MAG: cation:proton antiporter [Gammaproteobacteria bacterium]
MDVQWVAIALGDVVWIAMAFGLGFLSRSVGLPPMVGFLAAGFVLSGQGIASGESLGKLSDLGITLLLFTVGLKLNLQTLARPHVWAVSGLHAIVIVLVFGFALYGMALTGASLFSGLSFANALLIAFALSFSSTVFVVKVLESRSEMSSLHGRIAIGILIMQDLVAVVFLAVSAGKMPSPLAVSVLLLIPLRPVMLHLLSRVGHGELLVLYGFLLALGGAELFEMVGLKGDLGALVLGVVIASHPKAEELAKTMLGFKDLFLLGFFLSVGMSGKLTLEAIAIAALLTPFVLLKSALFFALLTRFKLRARTSWLASLNLSNYSEFGLIVASIGVASGWIENDWLIAIAVALALSFVMAAGLNTFSHSLYIRYRETLQRRQSTDRLADDRVVDLGEASVAVIGMGALGTGAYDKMRDLRGDTVVGIDFDPVTVASHKESGRNVLHGDPGDADFWDRVKSTYSVDLVLLALPKLNTNLAVLHELKASSFTGKVAVTAKFADEEEALRRAGATTVFNMYTEAGSGFASHAVE